MATATSERAQIERVLSRPVTDASRAVWGFKNRTDIVTLAGGDQVVLQRYRRREDAEHRLRMMRTLREPAEKVGIPIPHICESNLDADPAWVLFDALPGVPIPEAGEVGLEGRGCPRTRQMRRGRVAAVRVALQQHSRPETPGSRRAAARPAVPAAPSAAWAGPDQTEDSRAECGVEAVAARCVTRSAT
jgi:hypothetical protein